MNKVYIQILKEIGSLHNKEIQKAYIDKNGSYVVNDHGDHYYFAKDSSNYKVLEEGHTNKDELDGYFASPIDKPLPIRQGIEEDRKAIKYHFGFKQLKELFETSYTKGFLNKINWKEFIFVAINADPNLYKLEQNNGDDPKDIFFLNESHVVYSFLDDLFWLNTDDMYAIHDFLSDLRSVYSTFEKPNENREFSLSMLSSIATSSLSREVLTNPKKSDLYPFVKKVFDSLNEKYFNLDALIETALNHYTGTYFERPDYEKAEKELTLLLDNGVPFAANTLGYLTLYHGGEETPDYDKALGYFLIGASFGIIESKMKAADMFAKESCSYYSPNLAARMYNDLFPNAYFMFMDGDDTGSKFADIALRVSSLYSEEKYGQVNDESALCYLLLASYAIKRRMKFSPGCIGDNSVASSICDKLSKYKQEEITPTYKIRTNNECLFTIGQFKHAFKNLTITNLRKEDDGTCIMTITGGCLPYDAPNTLCELIFVLPRIKRAVIGDCLTIKFKADSSFDYKGKNGWFETISLSKNENCDDFTLCLGKEGTTERKFYSIKDPEIILPPSLLNEKKVKVASIGFPGFSMNAGKYYDYLVDDSFKVNDTVIINPASNSKGVIVSIREEYPSDLAFPLDSYKTLSNKKK